MPSGGIEKKFSLCLLANFVIFSFVASSLLSVSASSPHKDDLIREAEKLVGLGDSNAAKLLTDHILWDEPANVRALILRARCRLNLGDEQKAIVDLDHALAINSNYADAYFWRAQAWTILGKTVDAKADIAKAIKLAPKDAEIASGAGFIYASLNEPVKAIAQYDRALVLSPSNVVTRNKRAAVFAMDGQNDRALADYAQSIKLAKGAEEAYLGRAVIFERQGLYAQAAQEYRLLCENAVPKNISNSQKLACALVRAQQLDEALPICDKLIKICPEDYELFSLRARCQIGKGNLQKALADLNHAVTLSSATDKTALSLRASVYRSLGKIEMASTDEAKIKRMAE